MRLIKLLILISVAFLAAACGGGGGSTPPQRTATITFGVMSNITTQILGITLAAKLPPGVDVAFNPSTFELTKPSLRATTGTLQGGVNGTFSSSTNTVTLNWVGGGLTRDFGALPFAQLDCTIRPGVNLTQQDFTTLNTPFPAFVAAGADATTNAPASTDDIWAGKVTPTMTVNFGF
ncbi:hypothetical protein [Geomesophilobacter sediminis]|uniref:Lipoprotein n=1 Tax=Geomesophilobacter sediminis TaxID=2798584 RepID=A0A8J7JDJ6_9BACT|nr:hypothetical protein [Geomesophilobacter sediminis]MBJ6725376.1 hypothetical protein [Geomesophilobacter sediminis]